MADPNTRQGKRTPVTLKIKFKSETLEQFIERYAVDVSQGGIFIRTKDPLAVGTQMKFEFQLRDASPLIAGEGTVVWTRENDPSRPAIAPGMGVRFDRLADGSQGVLEKILAEKAKQAPQRGNAETTKPPMFTDTPTRVAPIAVQDALMGNRNRSDSEQTPLPKPVPFHSDADEFGAEAFEEATKVRALDELVAATAEDDESQRPTPTPPADELAARRTTPGTPTTADERDSAPALPSAPDTNAATGRTGKLLDTSPSPRPASPTTPPVRGSQPLPALTGEPPARTRLGVEPARAARPTDGVTPIAASAERPDAPSRPSAAPIVIGILVVVAAVIAAVWYFVLRTPVAQEVASTHDTNGAGSAVAGSAGSPVVAASGTGGAGSAAVTPGSAEAPKPATVDTEIAANVSTATVTVVDTGDAGPAPFKAKLEKDKAYQVRVAAPGYVTAQLDVKGGQDKVTAKLVAKVRVLSVQSDPPGAQIFVDSGAIGHATPYEVELTAAQAARPKLRITVRKAGYKAADQIVDSSAFTDDDQRLAASVELKLTPAPVSTNATTSSTHTGAAIGSGAGSATSPVTSPDAGSASPTVPSTLPSSGTGSAAPSGGGSTAPPATPPPAATTGSASEPEPDFVKKQP